MVSSYPVQVDGQHGWFHDDFENGNFHTFDEWITDESQFQPRKIQIFLPKDYDHEGHESVKYPVIYANDGQDCFFPAEESLQMAKILGNVLNQIRSNSSTTYQQPIIVAVFATGNRDDEYTHEEMVEGVGGQIDTYSNFICKVLKPWIEKNYRASSESSQNTIFGTSHGGLASFYIATRNPECFGNCICMSASFWVGMDSNHHEPLLAFEHLSEGSLIQPITDLLACKTQRPRIYIDWGCHRGGCMENLVTEAVVEKRCKELVDLLREVYNYVEFTNDNDTISELKAVEDPLGGHDFGAWRWRLFGALEWLISKQNVSPFVDTSVESDPNTSADYLNNNTDNELKNDSNNDNNGDPNVGDCDNYVESDSPDNDNDDHIIYCDNISHDTESNVVNDNGSDTKDYNINNNDNIIDDNDSKTAIDKAT